MSESRDNKEFKDLKEKEISEEVSINNVFKTACETGDLEKIKILFISGQTIDKNFIDEGLYKIVKFLGNDAQKATEAARLFLNKGANPNKLVDAGETVIFPAVINNNVELVKLLLEHGARTDIQNQDTIMPIHVARGERFKELVELLDKGEMLQKVSSTVADIGHVLGIEATFPVTLPNFDEPAIIDTEGTPLYNSSTLLLRLIDSYMQKNQINKNIDIFSKISDSFKLLKDYYSVTGDVDIQNFINQYKNKELTVIGSGWPGHNIGVGFMRIGNKDVVILCNRGEGRTEESTNLTIYPLIGDVNADLLSTLLNISREQKEVLDHLHTFIDFKNPIISLPAQDQKIGNCSFANLKSLIKGILYLSIHDRVNNNEELRSKLGLSTSKEVDLYVLKEVKKIYKNFTKFMRGEMTDDLLKMLINEEDPELKDLYQKLTFEVIKQHYGQPRLDLKNETKDQTEKQQKETMEKIENKLKKEASRSEKRNTEIQRVIKIITELNNKDSKSLDIIIEKLNENKIPLISILSSESSWEEIIKILLDHGFKESKEQKETKSEIKSRESQIPPAAIVYSKIDKQGKTSYPKEAEADLKEQVEENKEPTDSGMRPK